MLHSLFETLTVFHVNPLSYGTTPLNMDTGDAIGDLYFTMRSVVLPLECAAAPKGPDCANAEVVSSDLVVTKLELEVRPPFGPYGHCNVCVNGTDHEGNNTCTEGVYWCRCDFTADHQCGPSVGMENVSKAHPSVCFPWSPDYACWRSKTATKLPGLWYSTDSLGWCGEDGDRPGCTW